MAKGMNRGNREAKKPKAKKSADVAGGARNQTPAKVATVREAATDLRHRPNLPKSG